ncbi:MAG: HEAT repeat domain-containing protein [Deltaproteobacteria bacterium]|nr:HEAT repeat domain-containing protein [Deltaproteobacteria bacterium]
MIALLALVACGPSADEIATAIASENPVMREDGAKIAQNYADEVVEKALVSVTADPDEKTRLNAIESLAEIEATTATDALVDRLNNDESPRVRRAAADALGRLQAKDAAPALILYVQGFQPSDREMLAGVWALGSIGSEVGLDAEVRKAVLSTLVTLRESSNDRFVRWQATSALRTLK